MNNSINIQVRVFPVIAVDERTGVKSEGNIVLTKPQLQAAALVGWDYKTLIYSIYNKQGYKVTFIGKPAKKTLSIDLYLTNDGHVIAEGDEQIVFGGPTAPSGAVEF